jgi:hypothetical protein
MSRRALIMLALLVSSGLPAQGDDRCRQGYVWREAFTGDHVCVTPEVRQQTADDNGRDASRRDPQRPGFCLQGFVWREAGANDHACVTPAARDQARRDKGSAQSRIAGPNDTGSPASGQPDVSVSWRSGSNGSVPSGAVTGGWEKMESQPGSTDVRTEGPLYICRANFNGAVYVGKIVKDACNFGADGTEHRAGNYEVMTSKSVRDSLGWQRGGSVPPPGALAGGRSPAGHDVYICRISYSGGIHPGWQVPGRDACSIGYGGAEIQRPGMSYLVPQKGKPIDDR